jgi:Neuraminidase (sialidase)
LQLCSAYQQHLQQNYPKEINNPRSTIFKNNQIILQLQYTLTAPGPKNNVGRVGDFLAVLDQHKKQFKDPAFVKKVLKITAAVAATAITIGIAAAAIALYYKTHKSAVPFWKPTTTEKFLKDIKEQEKTIPFKHRKK